MKEFFVCLLFFCFLFLVVPLTPVFHMLNYFVVVVVLMFTTPISKGRQLLVWFLDYSLCVFIRAIGNYGNAGKE